MSPWIEVVVDTHQGAAQETVNVRLDQIVVVGPRHFVLACGKEYKCEPMHIAEIKEAIRDAFWKGDH